MSGKGEDFSFHNNGTKKHEIHRGRCNKDAIPGNQLWTDGLLCAFEFIRGRKKSVSKGQPSYQINDDSVKNQTPSYGGSIPVPQKESGNNLPKSGPFMKSGNHAAGSLNMVSQNSQLECFHSTEKCEGSHWAPIGWSRISELVQTVKVEADWSTQEFDTMDDEDDLTVADFVAPYWESPAGPRWWCHLAAGHPYVDAWLNNAHWLHLAISIALRDESKLISERMKHLLYEVPVRVAGGLLFELLGQSAGDPYVEEDDIPVVIRSWKAQNFLLTVLHVKGSASRINVLGIVEVQELLLGGGYSAPKTVHEIVAQLACRLARWDDRTSGLGE